MNEEVAKTLAVGASVLGALVLPPGNRDQDLLLPLLALGLRKEHEGERRVYCLPVHSKIWGTIAGMTNAFDFVSLLRDSRGAVRARPIAQGNYFEVRSVSDGFMLTQVKLRNWLEAATRPYNGAEVTIPADTPWLKAIVDQGREVLATLAHLAIADNHIFLLLCAHLQAGLQLSMSQKNARKAREEMTSRKLICRPCTVEEVLANADLSTWGYQPGGVVHCRLAQMFDHYNSVTPAELLEDCVFRMFMGRSDPAASKFFTCEFAEGLHPAIGAPDPAETRLNLRMGPFLEGILANRPMASLSGDWYELDPAQATADVLLLAGCLRAEEQLIGDASLCSIHNLDASLQRLGVGRHGQPVNPLAPEHWVREEGELTPQPNLRFAAANTNALAPAGRHGPSNLSNLLLSQSPAAEWPRMLQAADAGDGEASATEQPEREEQQAVQGRPAGVIDLTLSDDEEAADAATQPARTVAGAGGASAAAAGDPSATQPDFTFQTPSGPAARAASAAAAGPNPAAATLHAPPSDGTLSALREAARAAAANPASANPRLPLPLSPLGGAVGARSSADQVSQAIVSQTGGTGSTLGGLAHSDSENQSPQLGAAASAHPLSFASLALGNIDTSPARGWDLETAKQAAAFQRRLQEATAKTQGKRAGDLGEEANPKRAKLGQGSASQPSAAALNNPQPAAAANCGNGGAAAQEHAMGVPRVSAAMAPGQMVPHVPGGATGAAPRAQAAALGTQPQDGSRVQPSGQQKRTAREEEPANVKEWSLADMPTGKFMEMKFRSNEPYFILLDSAASQLSTRTASEEIEDSSGSMLALMTPQVRQAIQQRMLQREQAAAAASNTRQHSKKRLLVEIVLDDGRPVVIQFLDGTLDRLEVVADVRTTLRHFDTAISNWGVEGEGEAGGELAAAEGSVERVDKLFSVDNRLGIPSTLHRISALRNRAQRIIGLTCRVGRHLPGGGDMLTDILSKIADRKASMLLVGPPGVGKTTLLRDIVRLLADKFNIGSRVMVVDTSNEVGGDGDTPHPAIGNARRLQVQSRPNQHKELVEAVQNHNPRILVVDEIGNAAEAEALQGVGHRGACIIGTAHGNTLHDVLKNPELSLLLGGLAEATIGDRAALMNAGRKTKTERKGPPVFQILVEVLGFNKLHIHLDTTASVDAILSGKVPQTQHRVLRDGKMVASLEGGPTRAPYPNQSLARRPPAATPTPVPFNPAFAPAWQRGSLAEQGHGRVLRPVPPSEPYPGPSRRHASADMFGGVASQSVVRAQADFDTLEFLTGSLPKIVNRRR